MDTFASYIMLGLMIIIIIISYLSEKRVKKKISILEKQLKDSYELLRKSEMKVVANLEEIKLLKWQLSHVPKYKKGDKFDLWIVSSCELHKPSLSDFLAKALIGFISICAGYMPQKKKSTDLDMYWQYELTHTANGEKKKMSQSQLENFKPEA